MNICCLIRRFNTFTPSLSAVPITCDLCGTSLHKSINSPNPTLCCETELTVQTIDLLNAPTDHSTILTLIFLISQCFCPNLMGNNYLHIQQSNRLSHSSSVWPSDVIFYSFTALFSVESLTLIPRSQQPVSFLKAFLVIV